MRMTIEQEEAYRLCQSRPLVAKGYSPKVAYATMVCITTPLFVAFLWVVAKALGF